MHIRTFLRSTAALLAAAATLAIAGCSSGDDAPRDLVDRTAGLALPGAVHIAGTDTAQAGRVVRLAQELYTFWDTGDVAHLSNAVAQSFRDNTLPAGRPQGPTGPVAASRTFRAAIPDLSCELADLYVTGDTFTARLVFRGRFTGTYNGIRGTGQTIDFGAIDIQHVGNGARSSSDRIVSDWHLEDNLTFLQQAGLVTVAGA